MADDLFLTDHQIAERWGVAWPTAKAAIGVLAKNPRFPKPDPLFENMRFWPAVQAFMRWRAGIRPGAAMEAADGPESWPIKPLLTNPPGTPTLSKCK